jgi:hypothetical protein
MRFGAFLALVAVTRLGSADVASAALDPEVARGVKAVEEGDYETGLLILEAAANRLSGDRSRARDLAEAYLYIGIAYLGKGHETTAKARFRDALVHAADLKLTTEKFAPRVIEVFEKARDEIARTPAAASAAPASRPSKKKGSKTGLILLGVGGAAAAGIGVAAAAGGGEAQPERRTESFSGTFSRQQEVRPFTFTPRASGLFEATVTWTPPDALVELYLFEGTPLPGDPNLKARSNQISDTRAQLTFNVTAQLYTLNVYYNRCRGTCLSVPFQLTVTYP